MTKLDFVEAELGALSLLHRQRRLKRLASGGARCVRYAGKTLVNFSSNDYLGLSSHPRVRRAAQEAIEQYQASGSSSRLVCGNLEIHEELEEQLAKFKGKEAALVFSSGYLTNLGILTTLAGREDQIFSDALNHASIIDACRLSRAKTFVYRHRDSNHLEDLLRRAPGCRRRLLVSDAVFSMDGDLANLPELSALAAEYDCLLILDEAHATGVLGSQGRGLVEHFAEQGKIPEGQDCVDLRMGTLSKALGSFGGFVACGSQMRELLINKARSFIFSTALPPSAVGAALASLQLFQEQTSYLKLLRTQCNLMKQKLRDCGFDVSASESPIFPAVLGEEAESLKVSEALLEQGYLVPAIRPPSVPEGGSRLRITVTAAHSREEIAGLGDAIRQLTQRESLSPRN
jgi:8-amino-7-oxononanoate synthase